MKQNSASSIQFRLSLCALEWQCRDQPSGGNWPKQSPISTDLTRYEAPTVLSAAQVSRTPIPTNRRAHAEIWLVMKEQFIRRIGTGEGGRFFKVFLTGHKGKTLMRPGTDSGITWTVTIGQAGYGYVNRRDDQRFGINVGVISNPNSFQKGRIFQVKPQTVEPNVSLASAWCFSDHVVDHAPTDLILRVHLDNIIDSGVDDGHLIGRLLKEVPLPPAESTNGSVLWTKRAVSLLQGHSLVREMDLEELFTGAFWRARLLLGNDPRARDIWHNVLPERQKSNRSMASFRRLDQFYQQR